MIPANKHCMNTYCTAVKTIILNFSFNNNLLNIYFDDILNFAICILILFAFSIV